MNVIRKLIPLAALVAFPFAAPVFAQEEKPPISKRAEAVGWSGVVLVRKNGETVLHEAAGLADRANAVPNTLDTKFPVASFTKLFTAVLILQLAEEGLVDIDAAVSRYLPQHEIPAFDRVTLHQLLTHTSGLVVTEALGKDENGVSLPYTQPLSLDGYIRTYLDAPLREEEDRRFEYNNGDFALLTAVIEAVTGASYQEALETRILVPLEMENTGLITQGSEPADLAKGYRWDADTKTASDNPPLVKSNYFGAGAMYSTANDIARFTQRLYAGDIINQTSLARLTQTYPESASYGYGVWVRYPQYGRKVPKVMRRYGRIFGFSHLLSHFLEEDITVVVLSNTSALNPTVFEEALGSSLLD